MKTLKTLVERILKRPTTTNKKMKPQNLPKNFLLRFRLRSIANPSCVVRVMCQLSQTWIWQLTAVGRVMSGRQQERSFFMLSGRGKKKDIKYYFFRWLLSTEWENTEAAAASASLTLHAGIAKLSAALNKYGFFFGRWSIQFLKLWNKVFFFFSVLKALRYMG